MTVQQQSANAFNNYIGLIQQGMSPLDAYRQSGLSDVSQSIARRQSSQQSNAGMGQIGGMLVGKLGVQAAKDAITGKPILGALRTDISDAANTVGGWFGYTPAVETPQIIAAQRLGQAATNTASINSAIPAGATGTTGGATAGAGTTGAEGGLFAPGSTLSTALGAAGVGLGAYGAYQGIESGDPISAGMGGAGMAAGLNTLGMALGPVGWAAMIAAPVIGAMVVDNKVDARERNKRQTEHLRKLGYTDQQLQQLGRIDSQGRSVYFPDTQTKEERDASGREWDRMKASPNPNENPFRIPTAMWGYEGMLSTYGPEYLSNMREFDRYMATAAAIEMGGGFYNKNGEVLLRDQKAAKAAYEAAKNDPKKYAEYQARYENWKNTGVDTGFDWTDIDRQYGNFKAGDTRTAQKNLGSGDNPNWQPVTQIFDGKIWKWQEPTKTTNLQTK